MGANFQSMTLDGSLDRKEVEARFSQAQDQDRYENGHSYSGGFGMATGLLFENESFDNESAATEYLQEHCVKWDEARAVTYKFADKTRWIIGAWCAS